MMSLREVIKDAESRHVAIGHFNVSDLAALKGIFLAAREINIPIIIGVSEGEREFIGTRQVADLVKSLRNEFDFPIFLNADHTHSLDKIKEAVKAGFNAVLFDAGQKSLEENIQLTKEVINFVKSYNASQKTDVLVEGELGYIGGGSVILERIPEGVTIKKEDLTQPEEAKRFVLETGIDFLAPAVGNLHGMFADAPDPNLDIERIREIKEAAGVPLVLHGGSGISGDQFKLAIGAGISVIHINTELRVAWKRGLDLAFLSHPNEIVPYKILPEAVHEIEKVVLDKLRIFNNL
ncbi:tagatose-bisphosphate aldolase [Candidatus Wolfebacteria bacterium GWA1_42_9]|uniref:Tagatose-bisphosphate aldolase n=2 Tax=Candidatus Wolfeibacteriota TaxID=1752735 RepID=A0A1F8DMH4_9BACT|nr:MAG: Tagatose-bisphosphate aldolase [Parcubacteria group bacterium GW2011_GWB1_43_8b]OGM89636.1 MAG: tagatose-bisphosphate aldolase [Candidatus Wolfebacteria bacterium GWA1_42_9]